MRSLTECSGVNNFTIIRDSAEYPNNSIIMLARIRYLFPLIELYARVP